MNAAGVRIVVGTDGNTPYAPHFEMEDMVAAGMTPMQVIIAATRNGAQFLRMTDAGHDRGEQERRLPRARRESAGRHHQHAEDLVGVSARRAGGSLVVPITTVQDVAMNAVTCLACRDKRPPCFDEQHKHGNRKDEAEEHDEDHERIHVTGRKA